MFRGKKYKENITKFDAYKEYSLNDAIDILLSFLWHTIKTSILFYQITILTNTKGLNFTYCFVFFKEVLGILFI